MRSYFLKMLLANEDPETCVNPMSKSAKVPSILVLEIKILMPRQAPLFMFTVTNSYVQIEHFKRPRNEKLTMSDMVSIFIHLKRKLKRDFSG